MDKYEYKVRLEEIRSLISDGEFAHAVEIADTIDWRRVKSIKTLCTISDLYKINRRYQESKEILLMAYERYPGGRLIVYSLCELSIKLEEYVQAIEYYKEYVQLAPKDTNRYILQYRLYEAQDVGIEERIEVLEEFKHKDYREKWAYELAYLYHRMGLASKCVDECDELIVTFGEGKYVIKAMELKNLHEPLSATQQLKYDTWMAEKNGEILAEKGIADTSRAATLIKESTSDIKASIDDSDLQGAPTTKMPQEVDIQVKTVDVGQYNTTNLQEALAESMKDLWAGQEESVQEHSMQEQNPEQIPEPIPSTPQADVEDNTIFGTSPLAGILDEETKRIPTEAVVDYLESQKLREQMENSTAVFQAADAQTELIPGAITGQINVVGDVPNEYDKMLAQEYNGQIRLALAEAEQTEKQITGQLSIDDILAGWEETKKENEKKREQEVKERILQHTGSLFDEFDEDTKAELLAQLEKAFMEAIVKESKSGKPGSEDLGRRIRKEALRAVEELSKENIISSEEEPSETVNAIEEEAAKETAEPEEIAEEAEEESEKAQEEAEEESKEAQEEAKETAEPEEVSEEAEEESEEIPEEAEEETEEVSGETEEEPEDSQEETEEVKAVRQALADDEEDEKLASRKKKLPVVEVQVDEDGNRILTEEEEETFRAYIARRGTRKQIIQALDKMSMAAYTGNCIVTGEEGVGTMDLSKLLIKQMQSMDSNFVGNQIASIPGKKLNGKDISGVLDKLNGGALIIEHARGMKKSTVEALMKGLESENLGILVILEDTAEGIDRILTAIPKLSELFNVRIDLKALDDKALVNYACEYAISQEYTIDEYAVLALHTRIAELQTSDHQVTIAEVRELVDDAIYYADKKNIGHFFDIIFRRRYDSDDMIILREKDFMHY